MFIKATSTRFGLAALWVSKEDGSVELFRLEQIGRRIISRRVLWGDVARWNPEAQRAAESFKKEEAAGTADFRELLTVLVDQPLRKGEVTRKFKIGDTRLKGSINGMLFDVDLFLPGHPPTEIQPET